MVVGLLGILKAGGVYVPLDSSYPQERLQYMEKDAELAVLLTEKKFDGLFSTGRAGRICLDDKWAEIGGESEADLGVKMDAQNLAYVIYTSGSTGRPKGVAIAHHSASVLMHWAKETFSEDEMSGVLASTSICFDLSVFEIFVPLSWGGRVIVTGNALELTEIKTGGVRLVNTVPSAMRELVRMKGVPGSVRTVNLAGEALQESLVEQIYELKHVERVINLYGPSEDTTYSTFASLPGEGGRVTIGRPVANTQGYVLDEGMRVAPVGVNGELWLGGAGLARGYLNRPELSAERFAPNPFSESGGERLYRTGDEVRWTREGNLEFIGRLDHQVKIRGYRIELGEIEAAIKEHPSVEQAIVLAREDEPGENRLVGYVIARQQVSVRELREHLQESLPDYMLPGAIVQLEAMPLTPNGKIDRRALPKPELNGTGRFYVGPRNAVEEIVCVIWAEALRVEQVGIYDNFFELGGHSLMATQVVSRMRNLLGVEVSLRKLFTHPTAAAIAAEVEQQQRRGGETPVESIARVARDGELPLSYAQQRLWFIDQLEPGSAAYNIPCAVRLVGRLDVEALHRSLNEIIVRHEVLRTSFPFKDGEPRQKIHELGDLRPDFIDLTKSDERERQQKLDEVLGAEARRGFDLSSGPLIRAKLIRLAEEEHVLLVNMHHIVSDGWSIEVIIREVSQLYEAFRQGQESPLPDLEVQYADYAVWQRGWLQGETLDTQLRYWREKLDGVAVLELPTDRARPAVASNRGASEKFRLSKELTTGLKQMSQREGVTLFMSLLAGFQILLAR